MEKWLSGPKMQGIIGQLPILLCAQCRINLDYPGGGETPEAVRARAPARPSSLPRPPPAPAPVSLPRACSPGTTDHSVVLPPRLPAARVHPPPATRHPPTGTAPSPTPVPHDSFEHLSSDSPCSPRCSFLTPHWQYGLRLAGSDPSVGFELPFVSAARGHKLNARDSSFIYLPLSLPGQSMPLWYQSTRK